MPLLPALAQLGHSEKDALIAALTARLASADTRIVAQDIHIAAQDARIAALEARLDELTRPAKTPGNSSKPPSQGQKQDLPSPAVDRPPRKSRPGVGRTLHPNPDRTIDRRLSTCPKCEAVFPDTAARRCKVGRTSGSRRRSGTSAGKPGCTAKVKTLLAYEA